jgi:hypothetical protein
VSCQGCCQVCDLCGQTNDHLALVDKLDALDEQLAALNLL